MILLVSLKTDLRMENNPKEFGLRGASSGEQVYIALLFGIAANITDNPIILIDESPWN